MFTSWILPALSGPGSLFISGRRIGGSPALPFRNRWCSRKSTSQLQQADILAQLCLPHHNLAHSVLRHGPHRAHPPVLRRVVGSDLQSSPLIFNFIFCLSPRPRLSAKVFLYYEDSSVMVILQDSKMERKS